MKATTLIASFAAAAAILAASNFEATAQADSARGRPNDVIKSRPVTAPISIDGRKYRPARGCFAAGARDASSNTQVVCY